MERRIEQKVRVDLLPADVKTILSRQFGLTRHQISSAKFRRNGICRNGVPCRVNEQIYPGDRISVLLEEKMPGICDEKDGLVFDENGSQQPGAGRWEGNVEAVLPAGITWEMAASMVLYEDEDLLILNKPAGMAMHPAHGHYNDTLANLVAALYLKEGIHTKPRPVGRLDLETSGICVFAKNAVAAARLSARKTYLALAKGHFPEFEEGAVFIIDKPLHKIAGQLNRMETVEENEASEENEGNKEPGAIDEIDKKVCDPEKELRGKAAVTICTFLKETQENTLLQVQILTGRTHQIRAHLASIGHPLVGDRIYGRSARRIETDQAGQTPQTDHNQIVQNSTGAMLHCAVVELVHPITGKRICITAPLPEYFQLATK